jgi:uncharacterized protein YkwD
MRPKHQPLAKIFRVASLTIALLLVLGEFPAEWFQRLLKEDLFSTQPSRSKLNAPTPAIANMEVAIHERINEIRQENNLKPLRRNEKLVQVAREYSRQMAIKHFFAHASPSGDTVVQRVHAVGIFYWVMGENLFKSVNIAQPVEPAVRGWMKSPGHRENILYSAFTETGIGIWRQGNTYYVTQVFLRPLL